MEGDGKRTPFTMPDISGIDADKLGYGQRSGGRGGNKEPEYIMNNAKGRDIGSRLFLNTGIFWLGGFGAGGLYGFAEGWRSAASPSLRIRVNSVLNGISKRGSALGNNLGVASKYTWCKKNGFYLTSRFIFLFSVSSVFVYWNKLSGRRSA